jgi:hypothetical protein
MRPSHSIGINERTTSNRTRHSCHHPRQETEAESDLHTLQHEM